MKRLLFLVATVFILAAASFEAGSQETFRWGNLTIVTASGARHPFRVEVADTDLKRAQGLQWRKSLSAETGMLFDFHKPQPVFFWMKNTFVALDMIFIAGDGRIINIARETTPQSLTVIPSKAPARAVLEIAGGLAKRLGITKGDGVEHRIFE